MAMLTEGRMQVQIAVGFLALMLAIHICIQPYGLGTGANTSPNDVKTGALSNVWPSASIEDRFTSNCCCNRYKSMVLDVQCAMIRSSLL